MPTARFAQSLASIILYPMVGFSGVFVPIEELRSTVRAIAQAVPLTYAVSPLQGIWRGESWGAHLGDIAALLVVSAVCTAVAAGMFRWE